MKRAAHAKGIDIDGGMADQKDGQCQNGQHIALYLISLKQHLGAFGILLSRDYKEWLSRSRVEDIEKREPKNGKSWSVIWHL